MENKLFRSSISVMMIILMATSVFALPALMGDGVAAATMKLSKKKVVITVGKTYKLKVKNKGKKKVKWVSSKKSVATVSKSGKVKAKKAGKATITAKVGGKKLRCKVVVKNPAKGTITNPKLATESVTVSTKYGQMNFKAYIYKNADAVAKLQSNNDWDSYDATIYAKYANTHNLVMFFYDVKAVSGFTGSNKLSGTDIINSTRLYDSTGKNIVRYDPVYGSTGKEYIGHTNLRISGGQSGKMCVGFYVPKGTTSLMTPIYKFDANGTMFWVKYYF